MSDPPGFGKEGGCAHGREEEGGCRCFHHEGTRKDEQRNRGEQQHTAGNEESFTSALRQAGGNDQQPAETQPQTPEVEHGEACVTLTEGEHPEPKKDRMAGRVHVLCQQDFAQPLQRAAFHGGTHFTGA